MVDARPARRALILFSIALLATSAELGWWWVLNLKTAAKDRAVEHARLKSESRLAQELLRQSPDVFIERKWLENHFPKLAVHCGEDEIVCEVVPKQTEVEALNHQFDARVRMFIGEGAFLILMLVTGAMLMLRAMRREVVMVRQQGNFLAAVTHELKSPLATIRLYVETLRRRKLDGEQSARYLSTLDQETHRLEGLVNNVLLASRLSAPKRRRPRALSTPVETVALTEQAIVQQGEGRRDHVAWVRPASALWVNIDPTDWQTICRNLLDNASKYGGRDAKIICRLFVEGSDAVIEVQDHGEGLSVRDQKHVFEKFYRVGDELARRHEGSGLGLFLVRQLAEAAGGRAEVFSRGLGWGATFRVSLPTSKTAPASKSRLKERPGPLRARPYQRQAL